MLALAGSGEYLPPMEAVDRFLLAQLSVTPDVVCLPTAAGTEGAERIAYWATLGTSYFTRLGAQAEALPIVDRSSANDPDLVARLRRANFIYFSGGKPNYLYDTLLGSPAWDAVLAVHQNGGVVAGCSAGAMMMGEQIAGLVHRSPGFNLLPGAVILPHYDEIPEMMISAVSLFLPGDLSMLGIEGSTALICWPDHCQAKGQGGVTVWNQRHKTRYVDGQPVHWP